MSNRSFARRGAILTLAAAPLLGAAAPSVFSDWRDSAPGRSYHITPGDLPTPHATPSASNAPDPIDRPDQAMPRAPAGFTVTRFAGGLDEPRVLRIAPDGRLFVAETGAGKIRVFPAPGGGDGPAHSTVFASGLSQPYGIAFYPPGPAPRFMYVAESGRVLRFPYRPPATEAGPPETVLESLPTGGHWTRDIVAAADGTHLLLAIGSASNDTAPPDRSPAEIASYEAVHGRGASWGREANRADVLQLDPEGRDVRAYANGLRNCAGEAVQPATGQLWCVVNERDGLGDNLPPDYATRVRPGGFYGWPWYYIGASPDPRHDGARPDLAGDVIVPDVLIQPHSAPLGIAFYTGGMFPGGYRGDAFVALHGSWNRRNLTGYKVVRLRFDGDRATGVYEDFLTGFVAADGKVWGRPVGVAMAQDGALLVSDDASGSIWRVAH